ncbi:MAG: hypothetical protein RL263_947 [Bacteroidota bacterium]|jgi:organic hydroperoxide reductase OsmC/OhrA
MKTHSFKGSIIWTGNLGFGTCAYDQYGRNFEVNTPNKFPILGSADSAFRGDDERSNPEDFFMNALSSCHMLWYFHLCADRGIVVTEYSDNFEGTLEIGENGIGRMSQVILKPQVKIERNLSVDNALEIAEKLHAEAHKYCFMANSVNTEVLCHPQIEFT